MAKKKTLNVAMIGAQFMGKAHSNAWRKVDMFFDLPARPVMKVRRLVQSHPIGRQLGRQVRLSNDRSSAPDRRVVDGALELSDVARPRMGDDPAHGGRRNLGD